MRETADRPVGESRTAHENSREEAGREPWVETPQGTLFFLNAVLAAPVLLLMVPLLLGGILRGARLVTGPSAFLDPVPAVFAHVAPVVGWLAVLPAALCVKNLTMIRRPWARRALLLFLGLHVGVVAYTVFRWVG